MKLSVDAFAELVRQALVDVPPPFAGHLHALVVDVEPAPSAQDLRDLGVEDADDLLGMYHGTPLTERNLDFDEPLPDRITLFHRNIERICSTRDEIVREIRKTVLHEIGHHFGLDEEELEELGY